MEIWNFSYILMAFLCVLSFRQPTWQRVIICVAFCSEFWFHAWLDINEYLTGAVSYYLAGIVTTLIVLAGICLLSRPDKFTDRMVMVCLASIFLNGYGIIIYENSWKAGSYDMAFYVLYTVAAFIFMQKKGVMDGDSDARDSGPYLFYRKRDGFCREIHQEAHK